MDFFSKKRRGNTTVYSIAALLVVGFVGTALIRMSHHDILGGVDYYKATEARVAAKAGLQKFEHINENLADSIVQIVYDMAIDSQTDKWIIGDGSTYESLFGNSEYRVKAKSFDPQTFVIHLEAEARHRKSYAKVNAYYHLGNLEIKHDPGIAENFALYIGDVNTFSMLGPVDIDGGTYINGNVNWDLLADGSRFRGPFQTSNETNSQTWRGTYTFDTIAYFGTRVYADGGTHFNMMDMSGFDPRTNMTGSANYYDFHGTVYTNANFTGALDLDAHGNNVIHTTAFNPTSPSPGWSNANFIWGEENGAKTMDIRDSLGFNKTVCMPDLDMSVIESSKILKWSNVRNGGLGGAYTYNPGWDEIDGRMANVIYKYAVNNNLTWNGYAVLEIDRPIYVVWGAGDMFDGKMIIKVNDGKTYQPTSAARHFGTTTDATLVLYAEPGASIQNIGSWEMLRGYLYVDSGATCAMSGNGSIVDPIIGALHVADDADFSWYPMSTGGVPSITYDSTIIIDLTTDEFLSWPCTDTSMLEDDSIKFVNGLEIDYKLLGIDY